MADTTQKQIKVTANGDTSDAIRALQEMSTELGRQKKSFDDLRKSLDPAFASAEKYRQIQKQVADAVASGATRQEVANRVLEEAARRYQGVVPAAERAARAVEEQARANQELRATFDQTRASLDPVFNASKRYEAVLEQTNSALRAGVISQAEATRVLSLAETQYLSTGRAAQVMGAQMRASTQHTTNLMFQFQDIAMMLAAGQNPLMLAMQQGTQVSGVFQQMKNEGQSAFKGIIGGLAGMVSPMSLMTLGVIAGGVALGQWAISALSATDDADKLEESFESLKDATEGYTEALQDAEQPLISLIEKFGTQAAEAERVLDIMARLERIKFEAALAQSIEAITAQFEDLRDSIGIIDDLERKGQSAELVLRRFLRGLQDDTGLAEDDARALLVAVDDLGTATGPVQAASQLEKISELLVTAKENGADIPPEFIRVADEALQAALNMQLLSDAAASAADNAAAIQVPLGVSFATESPAEILGNLDVPTNQEPRGARTIWTTRRGGVDREAQERARRIESLVQDLKTEREVLEEWRAEGAELLAMANEAELEAIGGHNEAKLRMEEEYLDRLKQIQDQERNARLDTIKDFFSEGAALMRSGNDKLFKIGKAFAIANAVVAGIEAAQHAWAKGMAAGGPPLAAAFAALSVANTSARIAALKSAGSGSRGGGSVSSGSAPSAEAALPQQTTVVNLVGDVFSGEAVANLLNEFGNNGGRLNQNLIVRRT